MEWNVFYHDVNAHQIRTLNIFNHDRFSRDVSKYLKECQNKNEFAKKLKSELMYNFWAKAEYEVIITPWCGSRNTEEIKVDIYTQVMNNWNIFLDYVWNSKEADK